MTPPALNGYAVTGTGRCGTMLVQRLLALSPATECVHEFSVRYARLSGAYLRDSPADLYAELDDPFGVRLAAANAGGRSFGEVSALLFLCVPELARRHGDRMRFILLTRRAEDFVASALARGFFDATHPHALEHVRPRAGTDIARRWSDASPVEKCLWYWQLVNGTVLATFDRLPASQYLVLPIETVDLAACERLYRFLGLPDFAVVRDEAGALLARRINGTPGQGSAADANPRSVAASIGGISTWSERDRQAYQEWARPLMRRLYGDPT